MTNSARDREAEAVRATFSRHGYGFHYAAVKECVRLQVTRKTKWLVDTTEFPVEVNGTYLHTDIILRSARGLIVIECKRVNPALSTWGFGRSAFTSATASGRNLVRLDALIRPDPETAFTVRHLTAEHTDHQYNVGLEIKSDRPGDAQGSGGRAALDDAVTQALRGASGLINAMMGRPALFGPGTALRIVPVVLTTARIVTCNGDLADASLETGLLSDVDVSERPWVWLRVNASAHLRHRAEMTDPITMPPGTFGDLADAEHARSVGIVSWAGLLNFLNAASFHVGDNA